MPAPRDYKFIPLYQMMKYMEIGTKLKVPTAFAHKYILVFGNKNKLTKKEINFRNNMIELLIKKYKEKKEKRYEIYLYLLAFDPKNI